MIKTFIIKHRFALKWLGIAFTIKLFMFIFFALNLNAKLNPDLIVNGIFTLSGDTPRYYEPMDSFVNGSGYYSYCRMPGLLPIYAFLNLFLSQIWSKTFMIVFQFICSVISVYLLAATALLTYKNLRIFYITFFLYVFSSFVSIWDHYGLSDSFSVSFLIFSIYLITRFKISNSFIHLFLAGVFITWSVFIRPIHGLAVPVIVLIYLLNFKELAITIRNTLLYCLPLFVCLCLWTYKNYSETKRIIVLQGPLAECFPGITEELLSVRTLIVAWGGDIQPWAKNTDGEWFFSENPGLKTPQSSNVYTDKYNLDSLIKLRQKHSDSRDSSLSESERTSAKQYVILKSKIYADSYEEKHPFNYFFLNKLKLIKRFIFPNRLDDLPFPALRDMTLFQKAVKGFYYLLLLSVTAMGMIGSFISFSKRKFLPLIPLAFILVLTTVIGTVEQRYLAPAYGYLVIMVSVAMDSLFTKFYQKKLKF